MKYCCFFVSLLNVSSLQMLTAPCRARVETTTYLQFAKHPPHHSALLHIKTLERKYLQFYASNVSIAYPQHGAVNTKRRSSQKSARCRRSTLQLPIWPRDLHCFSFYFLVGNAYVLLFVVVQLGYVVTPLNRAPGKKCERGPNREKSKVNGRK